MWLFLTKFLVKKKKMRIKEYSFGSLVVHRSQIEKSILAPTNNRIQNVTLCGAIHTSEYGYPHHSCVKAHTEP